MRLNNDRGIGAIWLAITFMFLIGAAAISIDASGAFNTARTDQNTADLACLAGVRELPDTNAAINQTVNYAVANWPAMSGKTLTIVGTTATYSDGTGNSVAIDAQYNGDASKMHVTVTEQSDSFFGKALGASSIQVKQEAYCRGQTAGGGLGLLPVGVLPGGFAGDLFGPGPCTNGNCGGLDFGSGASDFEDNLATGVPFKLAKHHGNVGNPDPDSEDLPLNCAAVAVGSTCHMAKTKTGQMAGPLGKGLIERFKDISGSSSTFNYGGDTLDKDTPSQILGVDEATPLFAAFVSQPDWWIPSLYGPWTAAITSSHYYYDGEVAKCNSPRKAQVPIVDKNDNWDIGSPRGGYGNGTADVNKIIGFLDVIITLPNKAGDFQGNGGQLKFFSGDVIWYGPNAVCSDGSPIGVLNGIIGVGKNRVFLVDSTN